MIDAAAASCRLFCQVHLCLTALPPIHRFIRGKKGKGGGFGERQLQMLLSVMQPLHVLRKTILMPEPPTCFSAESLNLLPELYKAVRRKGCV